MNDNREIVKNLRWRGYLKLWRHSIWQAREKVKSRGTFLARLGVRIRAIRRVRRPVFILGCPRSGTTFLGNVMQELPGTTYYFEPPAMKYFTRLIYEKTVSQNQVNRFYRLGFRLLLAAAPGLGQRIIEKNPKHTWVAEALLKVFPDALFVVITRDGRDVALSLSEKPWHREESKATGRREPGGYLYGPYPHFYIERERAAEYEATSDFHRCIWIWKRYAEEVERLRESLPGYVQCPLRYEDLVRQPEAAMERILTFIGETDEESMRLVNEAAKNASESSVGRWKSVLGNRELEEVEREAGELMRKLGYQIADHPQVV